MGEFGEGTDFDVIHSLLSGAKKRKPRRRRPRAPSPREGFISRQARSAFETPLVESPSQVSTRPIMATDPITGERKVLIPGRFNPMDRGFMRPSHRGPAVQRRIHSGNEALIADMDRFIQSFKKSNTESLIRKQISTEDRMKQRLLDHEINRRTQKRGEYARAKEKALIRDDIAEFYKETANFTPRSNEELDNMAKEFAEHQLKNRKVRPPKTRYAYGRTSILSRTPKFKISRVMQLLGKVR